QHLFAVTATFAGPFEGGALEVRLPAWTPGSYLLREFARNVMRLDAADEKGARLAATKLDKARWRIDAGGAARIAVRTTVYANELMVRTSHLDATHAFFNGANLFLYRESQQGAPCLLSLDLPAGRRVAT